VLLVGLGAKLLDHRLGHGKGRLAEPQLEDLLTLPDELIRSLVDADGCGNGQTPDVQVEVDVESLVFSSRHFKRTPRETSFRLAPFAEGHHPQTIEIDRAENTLS
jgi:hypothetical protein